MITNFKIFEKKEKEYPRLGDYVCCTFQNPLSKELEILKTFLEENIGLIVDFKFTKKQKQYIIRYDVVVPKEIRPYFSLETPEGFYQKPFYWIYNAYRYNILFYSSDKENVEAEMKAKKFGL